MTESETDDDLKGLPDLPFDFKLVLTSANVTDAGLKELKGLKHIAILKLSTNINNRVWTHFISFFR